MGTFVVLALLSAAAIWVYKRVRRYKASAEAAALERERARGGQVSISGPPTAKQRSQVCDMCGKTYGEGCGSVHKHVNQIRGHEPAWLPSNFRAQAQGEFTWLCTRCNSFPALKWPRDDGAVASMKLHLGSAHYVGQFKGVHSPHTEMVPIAAEQVTGFTVTPPVRAQPEESESPVQGQPGPFNTL
jgi:hypothetical protein